MGDDADKPVIPEKGYKGARLTKLEASGRKRADMKTWRTKLQASKIKFDDTQKGIYLNHLRQFGRKQQACAAAGVGLDTVARHIENDPEFANAREEALAAYADVVQQLAWKLMSGVKKPIVGGQFKDEIITHELVHATNLLAMEMRKTDPAYKDRSEVDMNHKGGGVLVAPPGISAEDFVKQEEARNAGKKEPGADE